MAETWSYVRLRAAVQLLADAGSAVLRASLGKPGSTVQIGGETLNTGGAWGDNSALNGLLRGIGAGLDALYRAKLNELIAAYNLLRDDYNAAKVPTSAPEIPPLT